jgi:hypothetical protein
MMRRNLAATITQNAIVATQRLVSSMARNTKAVSTAHDACGSSA